MMARASAISFWLTPQRLATFFWHLWWTFMLHSAQKTQQHWLHFDIFSHVWCTNVLESGDWSSIKNIFSFWWPMHGFICTSSGNNPVTLYTLVPQCFGLYWQWINFPWNLAPSSWRVSCRVFLCLADVKCLNVRCCSSCWKYRIVKCLHPNLWVELKD